MMKYFSYVQNNSGGFFVGPAYHVIVEAPNAHVANAIAESGGLYFDGCDSGQDCSCCGDRWLRDYDHNGEDEPMIYGQTINQYLTESNEPDIIRRSQINNAKRSGAAIALIKVDGSMEIFQFPEGEDKS